MARIRRFVPVVTPLEDKVPVTFQVVGRKEWIYSAFEPGTFDEEEILIVTDPSDLSSVHEYLDKLKVAGVDSETSGPANQDKYYAMNPLNPDTTMVLLQVGSDEHVFLIEPALATYFKDWFESNQCLKLFHNAIYDYKWLFVKYGINVNRMYCSMLSEQALTAGIPGSKVGLGDVSRNYPPYYIISKAVRTMFIHMNNGVMSRVMVGYAVRDIPLLFPVFRGQLEVLKNKQLQQTASIEFDTIPCTAEMEIKGINLHQKRLKFMIEYWLEQQEKKGLEIIHEYTKRIKCLGKQTNFILPEMNEILDLQSNQQKMKALKLLGHDLDDVRRDTLKEIDDPIAQMLAEYSNITKFTSTYGENLLEKINPTTKRWHPRFSQMGAGGGEDTSSGGESKNTTATGRFSGDAQQAPRKADRYSLVKDKELEDKVRDYFKDVIYKLENPEQKEEVIA